MSIEAWALAHATHRSCTSTEFMYDDMASQSGRSLPVVYREFDLGRASDWHDEGCILDFFCGVGAKDARVLDFGPGDGWPSLRIAPFVAEVVGVDTSERPIHACEANAVRLGIENATFLSTRAETCLPFDDDSIDGITAASSIEQTPDPLQTLAELFRVLRPGGKLRLSYEGLRRYAGGQERIGWIGAGKAGAVVDLYDRDLEAQSARMIRVCTTIDRETAARRLDVPANGQFALDRLSVGRLERLEAAIDEVRVCRLRHPGGVSFIELCEQAGFNATGTHSGAAVARNLFASPTRRYRPADHAGLTEYLLPIIDSTVTLEAPLHSDPWITAVKPPQVGRSG